MLARGRAPLPVCAHGGLRALARVCLQARARARGANGARVI